MPGLTTGLQTANAVNENYGTSPYCLSCCSNTNPTFADESWRLVCAVTSKEAAADANKFGFEFRECSWPTERPMLIP
jgi:hypothetical protein